MKRNTVKVCVRTRPTHNFAQDFISLDETENVIQITHRHEEETAGISNNKQNSFKFRVDHIFHNSPQSAVYDMFARDTVQGVIDGINGAVMSYGQTGSGKTFTMIGDTHNYEHRGIAPRSLSQIFSEVNSRVEYEYRISCTYCELYGEKIYDLLTDLSNRNQTSDYTIVEEKDGRGCFVRGLTEVTVHDENEALNLLFSGELARTTAQHKLNRRSNRSHAIFTVYVQQRARSGISERVVHSKLHLVDLAGSERLKKTLDDSSGLGADEVTRRESMSINQSLTYLEQCVVALSRKGQTHVPYRQCKLTNILKDALGANCNTLVIACIWGEGEHLEETTSTLRLASRMMRVQNETTMVETVDSNALIKKQAKLIKALKQELLMHDALVERAGVVYDPYTPEQQAEIRQMIEKYMDCPEGEEDQVMNVNSYRQMLEICKQFKRLLLHSRSETKSARDDAYAQLADGQGSPSRDYLGTADFSDAKSAKEYESSYVGEVDEFKRTGFGLGVAAADSMPAGGMVSEPKTSSLRVPNSPTRRGAKDAKVDFNTEKPVDYGRSTYAATDGSRTMEAFINGEGYDLYNQLKSTKELSKSLKSRMREVTQSVNSAKYKIDELQNEIDVRKRSRIELLRSSGFKTAETDDIIDEDEYKLMKELKEAKRAYKNGYEQLQKLKGAAAQAAAESEACRINFSEEYSNWCANTRRLDRSEMEDLLNATGKSEAGFGSEDQLDDQEAFERLEVERVMTKDPESLAFFHAQKTRQAHMTQNGANIKQIHKSKRFG